MQMYLRNTNVVKYFLVIFLPSVCLLYVLLFVYHKREIKHDMEQKVSRIEANLEADRQIIINTIHSVVVDLLSFTRAREDNLTSKDSSRNKELAHDLLFYSKGKEVYDQIRYIDETGQELLRIDNNNGQPVVVSKEQLQNKAKRYYFTDTFKLNKSKIFISPLDLNIEHGQIEQPVKPMIRFGTPVFDHLGRKRGIVLLNFLASELLNQLNAKNSLVPGYTILLNEKGYWLKGRNSSDEWGFMYEDKKSHTFANRFPSRWEQISSRDSGQLFTQDGLIIYTTVYPIKGIDSLYSSTGAGEPFTMSSSSLTERQYYWKIVHHIPQEAISALSAMHRKNLYLLFASLVLFLALCSLLMATVIVKRILSREKLKEKEHTLAALLAESDRTKAELEEKTTLLDNILHSAQAVAIATTDLEFRITYYNPMAEKFFGYSAAEVIGKTVMEMHIKEEVMVDRFERAMEIVHREGEYCYSVTQQTENGVRELDSTVTGIFDTDNILVGYSLFAYNVTEHKQQKMELERLQSAINQTSETVLITDADGTIQYVNPAFETLTGYTAEEVIGKLPSCLKSGKHPVDFYEELWTTLKRGEVWRGRFSNKKKDGTLFEEIATISPVKNNEGQIVNFIAVKRDVTREVSLEKQLRHAVKMEALGTMAGGIAHDFNNILMAILGYGEIAKAELPANEPVGEYLEQIISSGKRATRLVQQILTFSRQGDVDRKPVTIQPVIREVLKLVRSTLPTTIKIEEELAENNTFIAADPTQIHQVLMNIITNAKHAVGDAPGTITVSLSEVQIPDSRHSDDYPQLKTGSYLELRISDTGCGMDKETQSKLFDPFFTTKRVEKGTGLGMAVVHGIIKEHDGEITVSSRLDHGTTFNIYFPRVDAEPEMVVYPLKKIPYGDERILLVDDEPVLINMMERVLENLGYRVTSFNSPLEALEAFKHDPQSFDILITDMNMPDINGVDLARECMNIRSGLPVILCSGFSESIDKENAMTFGIRHYMQKPITSYSLANTIRRVVADS